MLVPIWNDAGVYGLGEASPMVHGDASARDHGHHPRGVVGREGVITAWVLMSWERTAPRGPDTLMVIRRAAESSGIFAP
jgi:hypothetical protein